MITHPAEQILHQSLLTMRFFHNPCCVFCLRMLTLVWSRRRLALSNVIVVLSCLFGAFEESIDDFGEASLNKEYAHEIRAIENLYSNFGRVDLNNVGKCFCRHEQATRSYTRNS